MRAQRHTKNKEYCRENSCCVDRRSQTAPGLDKNMGTVKIMAFQELGLKVGVDAGTPCGYRGARVRGCQRGQGSASDWRNGQTSHI